MTAEGEVETAKFKIGDDVKVFTPRRPRNPARRRRGRSDRARRSHSRRIFQRSGEDGRYVQNLRRAALFHPGRLLARWRRTERSRFWVAAAVASTPLARKFFPEEVEEVLKQHPDIEDALIVGAPDEKWGQLVTGVIELRPGADFDEAALRNHVPPNVWLATRRLSGCSRFPRCFEPPTERLTTMARGTGRLRALGITRGKLRPPLRCLNSRCLQFLGSRC